MKHFDVLRAPLAAAFLVGGSAAFADVSPSDVWGDWKAQMSRYGYDISASESLSGPDLRISELEMRVTIPEDEGSVTVKLPGMTFHDNGDGTVAIKIPSILPLDIHVAAQDEPPVDIRVNYTSTGLAMTASGAPGALTYTYSAASMGLALAEIASEGQAVDFGDASVTLNNVTGSSVTSGSGLKTYRQDFSAQSLVYNIDMTNPENAEEHFALAGQISDLKSGGTSAIPADVDYEDMAAALAAGFAIDGSLEHRGGQSEFSFSGDGESASGTGTSTGGRIAVSMDADKIGYSVRSTGTQLNMMTPDLPFPLALALEETGIDVAIPVAKTDDPQDFRFALKLNGFTISEEIWAMFDPAGQLPRDPATLAFDLAGKVRLLADIFDPAQMSEDVPGELHALDVNGLTVRAVGAELTGQGGFTFDNSDMKSFDGMPRPEGRLNLDLTGGNALLDTLVAMGLLPEDEATGFRMMMGMFAVPGDGPDSLKSVIEVNAQGHVLANGQRLK